MQNQFERIIVIKNAVNNTEFTNAQSISVPDDFGINSTSTAVIDWTQNQYFVFTVSSSSAADNQYGSYYLIEKL